MTLVTQWFGMDTPPENPGVYEVTPMDGLVLQWWAKWDGKEWKMVDHTIKSAARNTTRSMSCYNKDETNRWRGLAEKPQ